jgi:hypothetical protein
VRESHEGQERKEEGRGRVMRGRIEKRRGEGES